MNGEWTRLRVVPLDEAEEFDEIGGYYESWSKSRVSYILAPDHIDGDYFVTSGDDINGYEFVETPTLTSRLHAMRICQRIRDEIDEELPKQMMIES